MVESGGSSWHSSNRGVSIYLCIYLALFAVVVVLAKQLHERPKLASILPEAGMIILVGAVAGGFIRLIAGEDQEAEIDDVAASLMSFSPTVFFVVLLPPIIFNSGYHLQRDLFFRFITPICLYACLGTVVAAVTVAGLLYVMTLAGILSFAPSFLELLAFGALISATDPVSTLAVFEAKKVDPQLFYLVFGESVINDAVGLVLFEALAHLIEIENDQAINMQKEVSQFFFDFIVGFVGSMVLGTIVALGIALFLKYVDLRKTPMLELSFYAGIMYSPFVLAEIVRLSGIVTVLFTGIVARRYAMPNLSENTAINSDLIFRLTAHVTETVIFLELGMSIVAISGYGYFDFGFIFLALVCCLIGRAVNIYPITMLYNSVVSCSTPASDSNDDKETKMLEADEETSQVTPTSDSDKVDDDTKIPMKLANMLWFVGLRGAVSYALVKTFPGPNHNTFVAATMFIVLFTTFLFGGTTECALQTLGIATGVDEVKYMEQLKTSKKGWLNRRLAALPIGKWVLRDYDGKPKTDGVEEDYYQEHVEMTELDHLKTAEAERQRKEGGIYDFGQ